MKFKNPANGYTEEFGWGAKIGVFFFGGIYLAIKGLWKHFVIWLILISACALAGPPGVFLGGLVLAIAYAVMIDDILSGDYQRRGWKYVADQPDGHSPQTDPAPATHKKCPFCAESILAQAKVCRYCQRDQPVELKSNDATSTESPDFLTNQLMSKYGISFNGTSYSFDVYTYNTLEDAVAYAKKQAQPTT